ncbi:hypothetical protein M2157_000987 [Streptomyces sp. SAI-127]|nr:hypothetical protein [Streptomyces sp. SAI-127]
MLRHETLLTRACSVTWSAGAASPTKAAPGAVLPFEKVGYSRNPATREVGAGRLPYRRPSAHSRQQVNVPGGQAGQVAIGSSRCERCRCRPYERLRAGGGGGSAMDRRSLDGRAGGGEDGGMDKKDLAEFLRYRREMLRPRDVGLVEGPRRRTQGLRREEVAQLAGMSTDYYARLEQQRAPQPSVHARAGLPHGPDPRDHTRSRGHGTRRATRSHGPPGRGSLSVPTLRPSLSCRSRR